MATPATSPSPLFRLPAEVRTIIYHFIFLSTLHVFLDRPSVSNSTPQLKYVPKRPHTSILLVCKTTFAEALPILYQRTPLYFIEAGACTNFVRAANFSELKLNIKHLLLAYPRLLSKTRISELKQLPNLARLTIESNWRWSSLRSCRGGASGIEIWNGLKSKTKTAAEEDKLMTWMKTWARDATWSTDLALMIVARPTINYEVIMQSPYLRVAYNSDAPDPENPNMSYMFRVTLSEEPNRYVFCLTGKQD